MPLSPVHKDKLKTNLAILGLIAAFCAIIFGITVVRISAGEQSPDVQTEEAVSQ